MITRVRLIPVFLILGLVAACGNERQESRRELFSRIRANWTQKIDGPAAATSNAAQLRAAAPALLEQVPSPMILMSQRKLGGADIFVLAEEIGDHRVFGSSNNMTVTLEGGVLAETRRLGDDLMSSENGPLPELLAAHSEGDYQRVMRTLDGEGHEISFSFDCRLTATETNRMVENCTAPGKAIKNIYEYSADTGLIAQSDQWLSPRHGHLTIEHLRH